MNDGKFYCYLLISEKRTYIGATVDPDRRLQQHNGLLSGGARATRGKIWNRVCYVSGFPDWNAALQFEWAWKHISRKYHGLENKLDGLITLIQRGRSTLTSTPFLLWNNHLCIHFTLHDTLFSKKIDKCNLQLSECACLNTTTPFPKSFCLFSFQMSTSDFSSNSISQLASMVEALRAEVTQVNARLDSLMAVRKPKSAADVTPMNRVDNDAHAEPKKKATKSKKIPADAPVANLSATLDAAANDTTIKKSRSRKPKTVATVADASVADASAADVLAAPDVSDKKRGRKAKPTADAPTADAPAADAPADASTAKKRGRKPKPAATDVTVNA